MRKQTTKVLEKPGNAGKHSQKAWLRAKSLLSDHRFLRPRLYHLILMDDIEWPDAGRFQKVWKAVCRELTRVGIAHEWRACIERDNEKGLHFHVFILVEAMYVNPCSVINTTKSTGTKKRGRKLAEGKYTTPPGWLRTLITNKAMTFNLAPPRAAIHLARDGKQLNYATLAGPKLDDCIERLSYLVKARSKPLDMRTIYFSSRAPRRTAPAEPALAIG